MNHKEFLFFRQLLIDNCFEQLIYSKAKSLFCFEFFHNLFQNETSSIHISFQMIPSFRFILFFFPSQKFELNQSDKNIPELFLSLDLI